MTDLAELNAMSADRAAELFRACCSAERWMKEMLARRPFRTRDAMLSAADDVWRSLDEADWREAFSHHPRIGERTSTAPQSERARVWSGGEQAGMHDAAADQRAALAEVNAAYEARFGYICIICATGKSAEELLAITRARLANAPFVELRVAAEEQRKITRLRLEKLLETQSRGGGAPK
jgi:OHCU decarboxylase